MSTIQRRLNTTAVAALILGLGGGAFAQSTIIGPSLTASSPASECHVGPAAGTYTCTVIVDAAPSASPSAAPSAVASATAVPPTASPTGAPTPAPTPTPTVTPTSVPSASPIPLVGCYGPCIGFDDLGNKTIDAGQNPQFYRFRATVTGSLTTVHFYVIDNGNKCGSSYSCGNGGTYRVTDQTCDSSGNPSGTVLGTAPDWSPGNPIANTMPTLTFGSPVATVAGTLYCVVWTNVDPSPASNYLSLDGTYTGNTQSPRQPKYPDNSFAWGIKQGSSWSIVPYQDPILDLGYTSGAHEGNGYMEVSQGGDASTISGTAQLRETFTPTADHVIAGGGLFMWRASGTSPLTVTLEGPSGAIVSTTIAASSIPIPGGTPPQTGSQSWATFSFGIAETLHAGTAYDLRFSTASGTSYGTLVIRKGVANWGYNAQTVFAEGNAQKGSGSSWSGAGRVPNQNDLPMYLQ